MGTREIDEIEIPTETWNAMKRLTAEIERLVTRIERLANVEPKQSILFGEGTLPSNHDENISATRVRATRPPLPDPRLIRHMIRQRQRRERYFDPELFADPAWDMLLDLTAARAEHQRVSITSLCIASGVPPTTALRWIGQMTEAGLLHRVEDDTDRRRAFITLTDQAADALARYFADAAAAAAMKGRI